MVIHNLQFFADHLPLLPSEGGRICCVPGMFPLSCDTTHLLWNIRTLHVHTHTVQKLNSGKRAVNDDFFDYVELVENPVKAILITNK